MTISATVAVLLQADGVMILRGAIIGAEFLLVVIGAYMLIVGKSFPNKRSNYEIRGWPARVGGVVCLLAFPLTYVGQFAAGVVIGFLHVPFTKASLIWLGFAIEGTIVVLCGVSVRILMFIYRVPKQQE